MSLDSHCCIPASCAAEPGLVPEYKEQHQQGARTRAVVLLSDRRALIVDMYTASTFMVPSKCLTCSSSCCLRSCRSPHSRAMFRVRTISFRCRSCQQLLERSAGTTWQQQARLRRQQHCSGSRRWQPSHIRSCLPALQVTSCHHSFLWHACLPRSASWELSCLKRSLDCGKLCRPWDCSRAPTGSAGGCLRL